ncbi:MAG: rRNA methyltransferase [Bryobacterales bacterium]|nr:rRNA methyltransferase [Bryobacterales bacterium]
MHPPDFVLQFLEEYFSAHPLPHARLERAVSLLSDHYRARHPTSSVPLTQEEKLAAYLLTRLPATYAAAYHVLAETARRLPAPPATILDLGAGMGAAAIAALEIFPHLQATLFEPDASFRKCGERLLPQAEWKPADLTGAPSFPVHSLVISSYVLGEIAVGRRDAVVARAWQASQSALVLIEPGSPAGFSVIRQARSQLLHLGAHLLAPCPASLPCPILEGDWCHCAQRLERTALQRRIKHAALSYEDEKFSYVVASRAPAASPEARLIRRPVHHPGLIELTLCRGDRIESAKVTTRDRGRFLWARHAVWGDALE